MLIIAFSLFSLSSWASVRCTAKCLVYETHGTILHDSALRESGKDQTVVLKMMETHCQAKRPSRSAALVVNSFEDREGELSRMEKTTSKNLVCSVIR